MDVKLESFVRLLQSCNTHQSIHVGKQLHLLFLKTGVLNATLTIANRLLQAYMRCGNSNDALLLLGEMPQRNCFSWNAVIEGFMKLGHKDKSLELFNLMPYKNDFSWNMLISGFAKAGDLKTARTLFNDMPRRSAMAWNSMIHCYVRNGFASEAVRLFKELNSDPVERLQCDNFVLATVVGACADLAAIQYGKQIHSHILVSGLEFDTVLASSLVNLYGKGSDMDYANSVLNLMKEPDDFCLSALISGYANCGKMKDARRAFDRISLASSISWNSMISGYISNNEEMEALHLFQKMRRNGVCEDASTLASVFTACSSLGIIELVTPVHAHACKVGVIDDVIVASVLLDTYSKCGMPSDACKLFSKLKVYDTILLNTMITVYSSCGRIEDAKHIFKTMPNKSLISWNSMIVGLSQNGCPIEVLDLFCSMNELNLRVDKFSIASVISVCGSISSLELGEQVFARVIIIGLESDQIISTSLVDFYSKCGFVKSGRKLFDVMIKSDEISWNSMLMGYAANGQGYEALTLFEEMRKTGTKPTNITFTAVLSACDHCGLVEEGRKWFRLMKWEYHIDPEIEHFSCMIDLFARAGCLSEAVGLIEQMPFDADASMWSSILRGCVAHGEKNLGKKISERMIALDPENASAYIQLSSIFASSGDWEKSSSVRKIMREKHIEKLPGCSWADC